MNINLNKKQYNILLWVLAISGTVYAVLGDIVDKKYKRKTKQIDMLEHQILKYAKDFNKESQVDVFEKKRYLSEKFMSRALDDLHEYEDYVFWEQLARKLAEKYLLKKYSKKQLKNMKHEKYLKKLWEAEDKYWKILMKQGLDNFDLKN